jgi:hypothetical protein
VLGPNGVADVSRCGALRAREFADFAGEEKTGRRPHKSGEAPATAAPDAPSGLAPELRHVLRTIDDSVERYVREAQLAACCGPEILDRLETLTPKEP